jgi:energy-coupling factor transporter ATP-binding protein EcfA2
MLLRSISYSEYAGGPQAWSIDGLTLGMRNLLVGKNATGKSRALNIIVNLAKNLTGERPPNLSSDYHVVFDDNGRVVEYRLAMEDQKVTQEQFGIAGESPLLERGMNGEGRIFAEKVIPGGTKMDFQTPQNEIAAFVRRDSKQHSFLEPLYQWASSLRHYRFGTPLGKDNFALPAKREVEPADGKDPDKVIGLFHRAKRDFPHLFLDTLMADLERAGYPVTTITIGEPLSVRFDADAPMPDPVCLLVKEKGLPGLTDQHSMSQGMFRALSLLIQVCYIECAQIPTCVVIDDIGEGLDFDRSCALISILRDKTKSGRIQLIASTNDRFVMNKVPLEEWSILQRDAGQVRVRNYGNSKKHFDAFHGMGMNNFDFFRYDFLSEDPDALLEEVGAGKIE